MKKIHFDNLGKKSYWVLLILLSLIFILVGFFELFQFDNPKNYNYISATGFLLQSLYFSKLFWHKNTVQWNDKGIVIRIKSFLGKSLRFDEIKETELSRKEMTFTKTDGQKIIIDLNEFRDSDNQKLYQIIFENTNTNNT
ncbi:hypothetical protein [Tenacibaculum sp. nBUS_03]|uniref:hypothetical protein n=1 Tax=Tenacibaculum sp. nBUS_03 TaxID=3395320 RepID=UPI003EBA9A81